LRPPFRQFKIEYSHVDRASYIHRKQGIQSQPLDPRQLTLSHTYRSKSGARFANQASVLWQLRGKHSHHQCRVGFDQHGDAVVGIRIDSTGGSNPILSHGHSKADAVAIRNIIEHYQQGLPQK
jgi:hypothetical protein